MASSEKSAGRLTMKLPNRTSRRLSATFFAVKPGSDNLFDRSDTDSLLNELSEIFSLSEYVELFEFRQAIHDCGSPSGLDFLTASTRLTQLLVDELKTSKERIRIAEIICLCMVGGVLPCPSSSEQRISLSKEFSLGMLRAGLLPVVITAFCKAAKAIRNLQLSESGAKCSSTSAKLTKESRLCLNMTLMILILHSDDTQVREFFAGNVFNGQNGIAFCLDLVASDDADLFPLKKILLLVRLMILMEFGGVGKSQFDDEKFVKTPKSRRSDVFRVCQHISDNFGPILCIPNSAHENGIELVTFVRTPKALVQRAEMARKYIHIGYSDTEDILKQNLFEEHYLPNNTTGPSKLYGVMQPQLRQYIVGILKLLLSVAPNVRRSAQMVNTSAEFMIWEDIQDLTETVERSRHTEILTKTIAFILLKLLKIFRRGHPLQFSTMLCLLQDKNALILILKFLNQNLSASLTKRNDIPHLSPFDDNMWRSSDRVSMLQLIAEAKPCQGHPCWRKYSAYSNMLRILQKVSKRAPRQIRSLVKFRAPELLIKLLHIPQIDLVVYTLKLLKSQVPFMDVKWRSDHVDVISCIYSSVRMDLFEEWLETVSSGTSVLEAENLLARSIRQHCQAFNSRIHRQCPGHSIYTLPENVDESIIVKAVLSEFPPSLPKEFARNWRNWLAEEGITAESPSKS